MRRLRTSARFLLRSLDLRAGSFLLALGAVVVGVSMAATAFDLRADIASKMSRELRVHGPNLLVSPSGVAAGAALDPDLARSLPALLGDRSATVCRLLLAAARVGSEGVTLAGADLDAARGLFPYWRVEGSWPAPTDGNSCLVGSRLARRLGLLPGSLVAIELGGRRVELKVSGIVSSGESEEDQIFVPLDWLQRLADRPTVSVAALRIDGGPEAVEEAARALEASGLPLSARPLRPVAAAEGHLLRKIELMMLLLSALILTTSALCVMTTLISSVVEREPEIGLMRSLGAGDGDILLMILGEATLLGLLGGLLGFGLGVLNAAFLGESLFGAAIAARPEVLPQTVGLAVALCWIGVLAPLRRALAIRPADALRGE